ncbi:hypothetical protein SAMN04488241_10185 [Sphingomonas rubra]|uniref:Uncharacterized protein n=1 Tax=Sphingomonas rubra TaxID=634430 RepID=A0A1I5PMJ5_9SPHN|nr:hypothetical protein SAMN04488241_10185 [Sphingomonas rubra]
MQISTPAQAGPSWETVRMREALLTSADATGPRPAPGWMSGRKSADLILREVGGERSYSAFSYTLYTLFTRLRIVSAIERMPWLSSRTQPISPRLAP